jgi:NMD protein affecting ribosome stability and mRNA decay
MVDNIQIRCGQCGFRTEVNPNKRRSTPKYCRKCGSVILAARRLESPSAELELVETYRDTLNKALKILHRVLGESESERKGTLRSITGMAPWEIREACRDYRRRNK